MAESTMNQASRGNVTTLASLKERTQGLPPDTALGFFSAGGLDLMQRAALLLANSTLVPEAYQIRKTDKKTGACVENPNAVSNCVLALNMAQRLGADPLMIMQNLYIVDGRPSWSSQFVISAINSCGRYSPLRYTMEDHGEQEVEYEVISGWERGFNGKSVPKKTKQREKIRNLSCVAWAIEKATGSRLEGPAVSMAMAVREGWYQKTGSKWQSMPDVMLRYRAASFFGKLYAPELLMGMQTEEEAQDMTITVDATSKDSIEMTLADIEPPAGTQAPKTEKKKRVKAKPENPGPDSDHSPEPQERAELLPTSQVEAPASENEAQAAVSWPEEKRFACVKEMPDGKPKMVTSEDCFYCADCEGCPNRVA